VVNVCARVALAGVQAVTLGEEVFECAGLGRRWFPDAVVAGLEGSFVVRLDPEPTGPVLDAGVSVGEMVRLSGSGCGSAARRVEAEEPDAVAVATRRT
jgi:hypothetical protein